MRLSIITWLCKTMPIKLTSLERTIRINNRAANLKEIPIRINPPPSLSRTRAEVEVKEARAIKRAVEAELPGLSPLLVSSCASMGTDAAILKIRENVPIGTRLTSIENLSKSTKRLSSLKTLVDRAEAEARDVGADEERGIGALRERKTKALVTRM